MYCANIGLLVNASTYSFLAFNSSEFLKVSIVPPITSPDSSKICSILVSAKLTVEKNRSSASMHNSGMGTDAENKARLDGMYWAEYLGSKMEKVWIATPDNRTRDSHAMLDGASVPLGDVFDNGLERPRDPNGIPSEICNCRCSLKHRDVGGIKGNTRFARQGEVTGSYKKSSSFEGTKSIEIPNMSYKEFMKWRKTQ